MNPAEKLHVLDGCFAAFAKRDDVIKLKLERGLTPFTACVNVFALVLGSV